MPDSQESNCSPDLTLSFDSFYERYVRPAAEQLRQRAQAEAEMYRQGLNLGFVQAGLWTGIPLSPAPERPSIPRRIIGEGLTSGHPAIPNIRPSSRFTEGYMKPKKTGFAKWENELKLKTLEGRLKNQNSVTVRGSGNGSTLYGDPYPVMVVTS